jgi:riboflavin kinase
LSFLKWAIRVGSLKVDPGSWKLFFTLYKLAELGACSRTVKVSTEYLAEKIGVSQQTASRHLINLEKIGWINRTITPEGCLTRITDSGIAELKRLYSDLRLIFEAVYPPSVTLEGILFSGLGEGAYYLTKEGYRKQFMEKLGFDPYPGTLNLKLTTEYDMKTMSELESYPTIEIQGFKDESRTFGAVKCYPAIINNKEKGAVVYALRSHYNASVLEIIAPVFLRGRLKLKDGNKVKVEILTLP